MEKEIPSIDKLKAMLRRAANPFTASYQIASIRSVLNGSSAFKGVNHLFLVDCFFQDKPVFSVSEKEALEQCELALKDGNKISYYYLYLLLKNKDSNTAINDLLLACEISYPKALFEYGFLLYKGETVKQDYKLAKQYFEKAIAGGIKKAYFYLLMIAEKERDYEEAESIYQRAMNDDYYLPGTVK